MGILEEKAKKGFYCKANVSVVTTVMILTVALSKQLEILAPPPILHRRRPPPTFCGVRSKGGVRQM